VEPAPGLLPPATQLDAEQSVGYGAELPERIRREPGIHRDDYLVGYWAQLAERSPAAEALTDNERAHREGWAASAERQALHARMLPVPEAADKADPALLRRSSREQAALDRAIMP
jgi:hypothetical protein